MPLFSSSPSWLLFVQFLLLQSSLTEAIPTPATNVSWNYDMNSYPYTQTGRITVNWRGTGGSNDAAYILNIEPLNYTDTFIAPAVSPVYSGYIMENNGDWNDGNKVLWDTMNGLALQVHGSNDEKITGRGTGPMVFRKIPINAWFETTLDCSNLLTIFTTNFRCAAMVFNGATNSSLFTAGLTSRNVSNTLRTTFDIVSPTVTGGGIFTPLVTVANRTTNVPWLTTDRLVIRIMRGPIGTNRVWNISVRLQSSNEAFSTSWTQLTVREGLLDSFIEADLWYGGTALAWGNTYNLTATMKILSFKMFMPIPTTPPTDLYGATDICFTGSTIVPYRITVPATNTNNSYSLAVSGLSGYFPYTLTITTVEINTLLTVTTNPLPGIYFYPRIAPPRFHMLGLWLDSKTLTAGTLARWADSSGRAHDVSQSVTTLRPTVTSGGPFGYSTVNFRRTIGTFLVGGSDIFDLGLASTNYTFYLMARGTTSSPQVVIGRGGPATTITGTEIGWTISIYNDLFQPFPGYLGFKVNDGVNARGAGVKLDWWIPSVGGYNLYTDIPVYSYTATTYNYPRNSTNAPFGTSVTQTGLQITASRELLASSTIGTNAFVDTLLTNTTQLSGMAWLTPTGSNASNASRAIALPPVSPSNSFRIGGPAVLNGNPLLAYDGDIWQVLVYREEHTPAQRKQVRNFLNQYMFGNLCMQDIRTPNTSSTGQCDVGFGYGAVRCHQTCPTGFQWFLGTGGDHWCQGGFWGGAPLLCKRACTDAFPPAYAATCSRTIVADTFEDAIYSAQLAWNASTSTRINTLWRRLQYITIPSLPHSHDRLVWAYRVDTVTMNGYLLATPSYSDTCARRSAAPTMLAYHPNGWTTYLPAGARAFASLNVWTEHANSTGGLVIRLQDSSNYYRLVLSNVTGIQFIRVVAGRAVVIGSVPVRIFPIYRQHWYTISINYISSSFIITIDNTTVLTITDSVGPTIGSLGMYAEGPATVRFDNISVSGTCDSTLTARNMVAGMRASFTCKSGYIPVGNMSVTCNDDGTYGGLKPLCQSLPPTFPVPSFTFSVLERADNGTVIGTVLAKPANIEQTLNFVLVSQTPYNDTYGTAFYIVGCSGAIRVRDPYQLEFDTNPTYTLLVQVIPDNLLVSSALINVTVSIINVPIPPVLFATTVTVNETYVGPVDTPVVIYNPDKYTMVYSLGAGDPRNLFSIDVNTSILSVRSPGLRYVDASAYDLLVQATTVEDPTISLASVLTVNVNDINNPPVIYDATFYITQADAGINGSYVGMVTAIDVDTFSTWGNLSVYFIDTTDTRSVPVRTDGPLNAQLNNTAPVFTIDSRTGIVTMASSLTYAPYAPVRWNGNQKVRDDYTFRVAVCDGENLCSYATVQVWILSGNATLSTAQISDFSSPTAGMKTEGGEIITFYGSDLFVNARVKANYSNNWASSGTNTDPITLTATDCQVLDESTVTCVTAPGYGTSFIWSIYLDDFPIPTVFPMVTSYAAPVIFSVDIDPTAITTLGSTVGALSIKGENLGYDIATPISIRYGKNMEFMALPHTVTSNEITATLGAGCGENLPIHLVVGGQSTSSDSSTIALTISYPLPTVETITSTVNAYSIDSLPTLGGIELILAGTNFGSMDVHPIASLHSETTGFTYFTACRKDDSFLAHTSMKCTVPPGVGYNFAWKVQVCDRESLPSTWLTSYKPPFLTRVSGMGAQRANTEGGQSIILHGENFGPVCCDIANPDVINWVKYGPLKMKVTMASSNTTGTIVPTDFPFAASTCQVTGSSPPQIHCLTGIGTGRDHSWQISIGNQISPVFMANTNYGAPSIFSFAGAAAEPVGASTEGYDNVTIYGSNFGPYYDPRLITVTYTDNPSIESDFSVSLGSGSTKIIPGNPPGTITYTPPWCVMVVPHHVLNCGLQPGAGRMLSWVIVVDEQVSTAPSTSYAIPVITNITLQAYPGASLPNSPSYASTDGGTFVDIWGYEFGPSTNSLIQRISFGPTGTEYSIEGNESLIHYDHKHIRVKLPPAGIAQGAPARFTMMVADQVSEASSVSLSFAKPVITSVTPSIADSESTSKTIITVTGYEFGLFDSSTETVIAFGNAGDNSLLPLVTPLYRSPSADDLLTDPLWQIDNRPPPPILQSISFALPKGLGADRTIRIVTYPRTSIPPPLSTIAKMPRQGITSSVDTFSYLPPAIDYIVVAPVVDPAELLRVNFLFGGSVGLNGTAVTEVRVLQIYGYSFGPVSNYNGDSLQRIVEVKPPNSNSNNDYLSLPTRIGNWSSRLIIAYSTLPAAVVRVRITGVDADGKTLSPSNVNTFAATQVSNEATYSDLSPSISSVVGPADGFSTAGGDILIFLAGGLDSCINLNVTVGGRMCTLLDSPVTQQPVDPQDVRTKIIDAQGIHPFPANFLWSITCAMPEGEGTVPIIISRDGVKSGSGIYVTYASPTITRVGIWDESVQNYFTLPYITDSSTIIIPTSSPLNLRNVRMEGTNFGLCPQLTFTINTVSPVVISACFPGPIDPTTGLVSSYTPNPLVRRGHTFIEFTSSEGIGTGKDVFPPLGWTFVLSVANNYAPGRILVRFPPPKVISISPNEGSTSGLYPTTSIYSGQPILLIVTVLNMGMTNYTPRVAIGSSSLSTSDNDKDNNYNVTDATNSTNLPSTIVTNEEYRWFPCLHVQRLTNTAVSCRLPEGSGRRLIARVIVGDQAGYGGEFNYSSPSITNISVATLLAVHNATDPVTSNLVYSFDYNITMTTGSLAGSSYVPLSLPVVPTDDTIIILDGNNLGIANTRYTNQSLPNLIINCVFVSFAARFDMPWALGSGTPSPASSLDCTDNQESFIGEGQIPTSYIYAYSHNRIIFQAPRGAGKRVITIRAGEQAPPEEYEMVGTKKALRTLLVYEAAQMFTPQYSLSPLTPLGLLPTTGGGLCRIHLTNLPRSPYPFNASLNAVFTYPTDLPLSPFYQEPTEYVVVNFGSRCISSAVDLLGQPARGTDRCLRNRIRNQIAVRLEDAELLDGGVTIVSPPGIGANISVSVSVISGEGKELHRTSFAYFAYDPPKITNVDPFPVYVFPSDNGSGEFETGSSTSTDTVIAPVTNPTITLSGLNFGRLSDLVGLPVDETLVEVFIGNVACISPIRIARAEADVIQCGLPINLLTVGHHNVTITIARQAGFLPANDTRALFLVCGSGLYGKVHEECITCPKGSYCPGYLPESKPTNAIRTMISNALRTGNNPQNFANDTVNNVLTYGRLQFDLTLGGAHAYPIPLPGYYNLNGSEATACPPLLAVPHRGVCIVPCMPASACLGDNKCADAYTSTPPMYRCSTCAKGFYRASGECVRCPDNAAAQFVLIILLVMFAAGSAYWINQSSINPAFISIGIDYLQVISIFAQAKIPWPPAVREVLHILSAFNLNLEILAPECLLPDVTFVKKFAAIMTVPVAVLAFFVFLHVFIVLYKRIIMAMDKHEVNGHAPALISSSLLLMYVLYLYITKNILDVFNCVPTEPPDGELYLAAVFEKCNVPGGTHLTLLPFAIIACLGYTLGYPLAVGFFHYMKRELIMEDQYIRAKGGGDTTLENPHAYVLRRSFSRIYYAFKPEWHWWVLVILFRKFCIAGTSLIFSRNIGFQMAACLLILFLAYVLQVRCLPYMSADEHPVVIQRLLHLAPSSPFHNRLLASLASVEAIGRKRGRKNKMQVNTDGEPTATAIFYWVTGALFNYNTVDAFLLFSAILINLCALLYTAARPTDSFYNTSRDSITVAFFIVITVSLIYWLTVAIVDTYLQVKEKNDARRRARGETLRTTTLRGKKSKGDPSGGISPTSTDEGTSPTSSTGSRSPVANKTGGGKGGNNFHDRFLSRLGPATSPTSTNMNQLIFSAGATKKDNEAAVHMNPMFTKKGGEAIVTSGQLMDAVSKAVVPPDQPTWEIFKESYASLHQQANLLTTRLNDYKIAAEKAQDELHAYLSGAGISTGSLSGMGNNNASASRTVNVGTVAKSTVVRAVFAQVPVEKPDIVKDTAKEKRKPKTSKNDSASDDDDDDDSDYEDAKDSKDDDAARKDEDDAPKSNITKAAALRQSKAAGLHMIKQATSKSTSTGGVTNAPLSLKSVRESVNNEATNSTASSGPRLMGRGVGASYMQAVKKSDT